MAPVLLIVAEGKTEVDILTKLRSHWRIPSASIVAVGQAGAPITVVRRAKQLRADMRGSPETWAVFDRDEHTSWKQAIAEAEHIGINLGISNPCIEQWGLLLHGDQRAALHRHTAQKKLSEVHPAYHHDDNPLLDLTATLEGRVAASARAKIINDEAKSLGERHRAPTTFFSVLVERLRSLRANTDCCALCATPG